MPDTISTNQQLVTGSRMDAWQLMLRAHCVIARTLDAELQAAHGMTLSDYDVLISLRDAQGGELKMSDLSRRTLLTRSGMTRLVQGLERDDLISRRPCTADARVSYASLTEAGQARLAIARVTHHAGIRRVFADHFTEEEAATLATLLSHIPELADGAAGCCGA